MKIIYEEYSAEEIIPVREYLKNKKLKKYFNRETEASIVALSRLTEGIDLNEDTPFYYALGAIEYSIKSVAEDCLDTSGNFSNYLFLHKSYGNVSPLRQLRYLQNMPLSFVSLEFNLRGDNAVVYSSAISLINCVLASVPNKEILIGASKGYFDGSVEIGFALLKKEDISNCNIKDKNIDAISLFKDGILENCK